MGFWRSSMPEGMSLKSDGHASSLYEPSGSFVLSTYCAEKNVPYDDLGIPVSLSTFVSYGLAFQGRFVPHVEEKTVTSVTKARTGFSLTLDSGETFDARRLVVAVGVGYFAFIPPPLSSLPERFVSHSSQHADLSSFKNQDVAIIGAGASAVDMAALLQQNGARPVVIVRRPSVEFHRLQRLPRTMRAKILAPTSGIGPGWRSWFFCNAPQIFHQLPEGWRLRVTKGHLGPAGGWFMKDAVMGKIPMMTNTVVEEAAVENDRVILRLSSRNAESSTLMVDHVIAATGFRVDVDRIDFLDESLRECIDVVEKTPILSSNFESSVPGLYFVGPAAANSFGPLQRFAVGAKFAARHLSRHLAREKSSS
jgi:thioredoxin reductase